MNFLKFVINKHKRGIQDMENLKSTYIKLSVFYLCVKSYSFFEIVSSKLIAKQILKNSCN